jgi:hypothetical protein
MQVVDIRHLRIGDYDSQLYARSLATLAELVEDEDIWRRVQEGLTKPGRDEVLSETLSAVDRSQLLWRFNKSIDNPVLRQRISTQIAATERMQFPGGDISAQAGIGGAHLATFQRDGIVELPPLLSDREIGEVVDHVNAGTETITEKSIRHHSITSIVHAPHILRAVSASWLLSLIESYLETSPTLVDISLWESHPGHPEPLGAQIFHRDRDDFRACKLFIYLNDVGPDHGPHIFVKGSHSPTEIRERISAVGDTTISSLFRNDGRKVSSRIEGLFGTAVTEVTGRAGTTFLENTYGFHRGKVPKTGSRLMLQAMYATIPYAQRISRMASGRVGQLPSGYVEGAQMCHALRLLL